MKMVFIITATLLVGACAYPTSSIEQGTEAGHLHFVGAAPGASILVDGQNRGVIGASGSSTVDVQPGRHEVGEASGGGAVIFHREYDVGAGATVEIGAGN